MLLVVFTTTRHRMPKVPTTYIFHFQHCLYHVLFTHIQAMPWHKKFKTFTTEANDSISKPVHVGFVVHKLAMGQVFFRVLWSAHLYHAASVPCSFTNPSITGTTQFQQSTTPLLNNTLHPHQSSLLYLFTVSIFLMLPLSHTFKSFVY